MKDMTSTLGLAPQGEGWELKGGKWRKGKGKLTSLDVFGCLGLHSIRITLFHSSFPPLSPNIGLKKMVALKGKWIILSLHLLLFNPIRECMASFKPLSLTPSPFPTSSFQPNMD